MIQIKDPSGARNINREDVKKILKGLGIAAVGAIITYLTELIPMIEWGAYTPIVVAIASVGTNVFIKYFQGK